MSEKVYCKNCIYFARSSGSQDYGIFCIKPTSFGKDWHSDNVKERLECEIKNKDNDCKDYHEYFWKKWFK